MIAGAAFALIGCLFTFSVAFISPASTNRTLRIRLFMLVAWVATGGLFAVMEWLTGDHAAGPLWLTLNVCMFWLEMVIAINEREQWGPRVARAIPRPWWQRVPAFLVYSGAAGGVLFAVVMIGLSFLGIELVKVFYPPAQTDASRRDSKILAALSLYTFCYAMTAVQLRSTVRLRIKATYTWIVFLILVAVGSVGSYLIAFLVYFHDWDFKVHYLWLLPNPFAAIEAIDRGFGDAFLIFAGIWAGLATLGSVPWFWRQVRAFRPRVGTKSAPPDRQEQPIPAVAGRWQ